MQTTNNVRGVSQFQYIRLLREKGPQQWFWEEIKSINAIR